MKNLKIAHQLSMLGAFIVAGFIGVGLIYAYSLSIQRDAIAQERRVAETANRIDDIHIEALQARRKEKDFLLYLKAADAGEHDKIMAGLAEETHRLRALLPEDRQRAIVDEMQKLLNEYRNEFRRVASLYTEIGLDADSGLQGESRKAAHGVETAIQSADDIRLNDALLQARRHEKDFLLRQDDKYLEQFNREIAGFSTLLAGEKLAAATGAGIGQQLAVYRDKFLALAEKMKAANAQIENMRRIAREIEPSFAKLHEELKKIEAAGAEIQQGQLRRATLLMVAAIGAVGVVLVVLLTLLGRRIVRSLAGGSSSRRGTRDRRSNCPHRRDRRRRGRPIVARPANHERRIAPDRGPSHPVHRASELRRRRDRPGQRRPEPADRRAGQRAWRKPPLRWKS